MAFPLDTLGRSLNDLRISVIDQCNLRCYYCMPEETFGPHYAFLKPQALLSFEEIVRLARLFGQLGVRKIRVTGGEPLLRKGLEQLVAMLGQIPNLQDFALTTNGILLETFSEPLQQAGLKRVTVSLDALDETIFKQMNGRRVSVQKVLRGIDAASAAGLSIKINMVVQNGVNDDQILPMARWSRARGYTLRLIEFMDVGNHNGWTLDQVYPGKKMIETIARDSPLEALDPNYRGEVAQRYRYLGTEDEIGIITSVTQPFCQNCTRARLSADGKLYTCLFATEGWDLKQHLRAGDSDEKILHTLQNIWQARFDRYSEERREMIEKKPSPDKVEMSYIGG